ncbi:hypothetical protein PSACC_03668 [Paramicrosporidium saccamoebae]|uniref:Spermatogenesis-associated protein 20 n=1 Tax=Paramicrosporidium saccamoebae TaxID=1246581 RepID=A0A2H9TFB1_9FUNG|nr:hypothetical protein PSACC_03668 [Paramicrosporidium saccamoebae]
MLYDQGQLLAAFAEAARLNPGNREYLDAVEDIITYIRTNLRHPEGGFYCAEDADSLPVEEAKLKLEGAFAVWTFQEIQDSLPDDVAKVFNSHYGVEEKGNVPTGLDHHGELRNQNVLIEQRSVKETAELFRLSFQECHRMLAQAKETLAAVRALRPRPHLDDKILVAWNALAISGLCSAYSVTANPSTLLLAEQAANFIKANMVAEDNCLVRSYRNGPSTISGFAADYVFLTSALLDLWNCTLKPQYLEWAVQVQAKCDTLFWDDENYGYFSSPKNAQDIQLRLKDSVNSVAAMNLLRLDLIVEDKGYRSKFAQLLSSLSNEMKDAPDARPSLLAALIFDMALPRKLTFLIPAQFTNDPLSNENIMSLKKACGQGPFQVFAVQESGKTEVQVCRGTTCQKPVGTCEELKEILKN